MIYPAGMTPEEKERFAQRLEDALVGPHKLTSPFHDFIKSMKEAERMLHGITILMHPVTWAKLRRRPLPGHPGPFYPRRLKRGRMRGK